MADNSNMRDVKLSNNDNQAASSTASSDFDRLEDCSEAEFRGATLSLSQETSPSFEPSPNIGAAAANDVNANVAEGTSSDGANRQRSASLRMPHRSEVQEFFAVREGVLQKAAEQCQPVLLENLDGSLRGIWLLTEIDHWDTEKERMIFLTENSLISLKYDFITLRLLDYKRLPLTQFKQIVVGELKYPDKSLMPKINGAVDFVKQRIVQKIIQGKKSRSSTNNRPQKLAVVGGRLSSRNQLGVQCSWSQIQPVPVLKRWNPWSRDIPWVTYTSHPLLKTETGSSDNYDIEDFSKKLIEVIDKVKRPATTLPSPTEASAASGPCSILYQPIIIESYAGLVAALHNANELGFFKSRGKVSF